MTAGTSTPVGLSNLGPALVTPRSDQSAPVPSPGMANRRYSDKVIRTSQAYCARPQQFVKQGHPEPQMIYRRLMILHRTILPWICSILLFHPHPSSLPWLTTTLQSSEEFSFFYFYFLMALSFGTFKLMVLKISDYWKETERRGEGRKERERELEARGCPFGNWRTQCRWSEDQFNSWDISVCICVWSCEFTGN